MAHAGFPPSRSRANDDSALDYLEQLGAAPALWETADLQLLEQLVVFESLRWTQSDDHAVDEALVRLYEVFARRADDGQRMQALAEIGKTSESVSRSARVPIGAAAGHLFLFDSSPSIVATAALQQGSLGGTEEDHLGGARAVLEIAHGDDDPVRRAAILGGLLSLGDQRVADLLGDCWEYLDPSAYDTFARMASAPTTVVMDFFLRWAQFSVSQESEPGLGFIAAGLLLLEQRASAPIGDLAESGVMEIDRALPVWLRPEDDVVRLLRRWTPVEYARLIAPRLIEIARRESYPRIFPRVLRAWGLPDVPHFEAVAESAEGAAQTPETLAVMREPAQAGVLPEWDQPNVILEWGIINPFGPTLCQLSLVPMADDKGHALVWTQHHFLEPKCVVWATGRTADAAALRRVLSEIFGRNGSPERILLKALPHWVRIPEDGPIDRDVASSLIRSAHVCWLREAGTQGDDPDEECERLKRLAEDPIAEIKRQEAAAFEQLRTPEGKSALVALQRLSHDPKAEISQEDYSWVFKDDVTPSSPAEPAAYRRWIDVAASPAHVERIRSYYDGAWNEAVRRWNGPQS